MREDMARSTMRLRAQWLLRSSPSRGPSARAASSGFPGVRAFKTPFSTSPGPGAGSIDFGTFGPPRTGKIKNSGPKHAIIHGLPNLFVGRWHTAESSCRAGNWVADMQVVLSEMQKSFSRCKVFASRAAKPACRPTIFTGRPSVFASRVADLNVEPPFSPVGRTVYYFTISFPVGSRQRFLHLGSRNLNVEPPFSPVGRTVYYFTISFPVGSRQRFLHLGSRNLNVEPPFSPVGRTVYYFTISFPVGSRQRFLHLGSRNLNVE